MKVNWFYSEFTLFVTPHIIYVDHNDTTTLQDTGNRFAWCLSSRFTKDFLVVVYCPQVVICRFACGGYSNLELVP